LRAFGGYAIISDGLEDKLQVPFINDTFDTKGIIPSTIRAFSPNVSVTKVYSSFSRILAQARPNYYTPPLKAKDILYKVITI
jgi:hypothetical protein